MLILQDPSDPNSTYLLESLSVACESATKFAGAFAFASPAGVRLVTQNPEFQAVAQANTVDLVVGVDDVTNTDAINALAEAAGSAQDFRVRAFLNPRNDVIFHPKFFWTKKPDAGEVIVGSGNLTEKLSRVARYKKNRYGSLFGVASEQEGTVACSRPESIPVT